MKGRLRYLATVALVYLVYILFTRAISGFITSNLRTGSRELPTSRIKPLILPKMQLSSEAFKLMVKAIQSLQVEEFLAEAKTAPSNPDLYKSYLSGPKLRILVAATWRTGSTFLGELLNSYPGVFYSFEPMHFIDRNQRINDGFPAEHAVHLLTAIFRCDFHNQSRYLEHCKKKDFHFLLHHNTRLWDACEGNTTICGDPHFITSLCQYSPIHLIKSVRLRLKHTQHLLEKFENLRVIWLTRNPGGIFVSRYQMSWCQHPTCRDPSKVCYDLYQDWTAFQNLTQEHPGKLYHIKYEDLSTKPDFEVKKLLDFLNLPKVQRVNDYIQTHTKLPQGGSQPLALRDPYGTLRNSNKTVNQWKQKLGFWQRIKVLNACKLFMNAVHY